MQAFFSLYVTYIFERPNDGELNIRRRRRRRRRRSCYIFFVQFTNWRVVRWISERNDEKCRPFFLCMSPTFSSARYIRRRRRRRSCYIFLQRIRRFDFALKRGLIFGETTL